MDTLPNHTITLTQAYAGLEGDEAVHAMIHDLPLQLDPVLQPFDDVHPAHVVEALEEYTAQYRAQHGHWDRWISPDFYELADALEGVRGTVYGDGDPRTVTLQDALFDATEDTKRIFTDICNRELVQTGALTLERRADIALGALAQETALAQTNSETHAKLASMNGQITVCTIVTDEDVHIAIEPQGVDLDIRQARELAKALVALADELDELEAMLAQAEQLGKGTVGSAHGEVHPSWCTRERDCYASSDASDPGDTALHQRTYRTSNGIDLFRVLAVGTDAPEIVPTWSDIQARDIPATAQVLLQIFQDLTGTFPTEASLD